MDWSPGRGQLMVSSQGSWSPRRLRGWGLWGDRGWGRANLETCGLVGVPVLHLQLFGKMMGRCHDEPWAPSRSGWRKPIIRLRVTALLCPPPCPHPRLQVFTALPASGYPGRGLSCQASHPGLTGARRGTARWYLNWRRTWQTQSASASL